MKPHIPVYILTEATSKVAVVTGASIGIGLAAATAFAEAGADVVLLYARSKHTEKIASDLADRTGVKVKAYQLDGEWLPVISRRIIDTPLLLQVRDYDATQRLVENVVTEFGRLDIWVSILHAWNTNTSLIDSSGSQCRYSSR